MTVLVDPPQRGRPGKGSASTASTQGQPEQGQPEQGQSQQEQSGQGQSGQGQPQPEQSGQPRSGQDQSEASPGHPAAPEAPPKLAEPPISGGKVEALMGRLIKVLAHSPLARPLPAVTLSALGLLGVAFAGLCATAPHPSRATPPVLLPLTDVARQLGAPHLNSDASNILMYASIGLCCLGLAMMLWANSHLGWSPSPRKVFAVAAGAIAVLVNISPVGSADIASYAAYGRIAALGHNPYVFTPYYLPGQNSNPYTAIINPMWRKTPSVYGPIATWVQTLAAEIGGARAWVTIWMLMIFMAVAFLATGYVLIRTADNPVRASLMWVANPLLIVELVMGGHLDALLALTAICAIVLSRRTKTVRDDILVGLFVGISGAIKINAIYVALAIAIPLIHDRDWQRLARTMSVAGATVTALYYFSWGFGALEPLRSASKMVISPTIWRLLQVWAQDINPSTHSQDMVTTIIGFAWEPIMLAIAWYLYNRLSPDVPTVVAATCALTFAWVIAESWSLPWYTAIAWVTLALIPRNSLTRWLTLATAVLALVHFNGGWPPATSLGPTP